MGWEGNYDETGKLPEYVALPVTLHVAFNDPSKLTEVTVDNANKSNGFVTKAEAVLNYSDGTTSKKLVLDAELADYAPFEFVWEDNGTTVTSVDFTVLEAINYGGESVTNMLTLAEMELVYTEVEEPVKPVEPIYYEQSDVKLTMTNEFLPTDDGTNVTRFIQQGSYDGLFNGAMTRDFEFIWDIESNWTAEGKLPEHVTLPVTLHVTFNEPSELTEINVYNANKANGFITKAEAVLHYSDGTDSEKLTIALDELANYAPFEFVWSDNGKTVDSVDITILEAIKSNGDPVNNMLTLAELELIYNEDTTVHQHQYEAVVTEPTCTEGGFTTYTCACGDSYIADETAALGHDFVDGECSRCDAVEPSEPGVNPFEDVAEDVYYYDPVMWAVENDITKGTDDTHFSPDLAVNRAQVVTFLWRASGSPEPTSTNNPFVDVTEKDFFYKAVLWAVENGVTKGTDATHFAPALDCNRAQVVTFLWRAAGKPEATGTNNPFVDVAEGDFFNDAVLWAVEAGVTKGVSTTAFGVDGICNRAQVVTFLYRAFK